MLKADWAFHLTTIRGFSSGGTDENDVGCAAATGVGQKKKEIITDYIIEYDRLACTRLNIGFHVSPSFQKT